MSWLLKKRIKIAPGLRLNISDITSTLGTRATSVNHRSKGVYLSSDMIGTGVYKRQKNNSNSPHSNSTKDKRNASGCLLMSLIAFLFMTFIGILLVRNDEMKGWGTFILFCSAICVLILLIAYINSLVSNSPLMKSKKKQQLFNQQIDTAKKTYSQASNQIQKDILQNFISCYQLNNRASETEAIIDSLKKKLERKPSEELENQLKIHEMKLAEIETELKEVQIDVDKDLTDDEKRQYSILCESFEKLLDSHKTWIITSSIKNTELKSSAAYSIERKEVKFDIGVFNFIKSSFDIPILRDLNDYTYYIYPRYVIRVLSFANFEVFPIDSITVKYSTQRFIEDDSVPNDTLIVNYTYKYVNKDGSPDKRFSYNPRLSVVEYGKIEIDKLKLTYQISNKQSAQEFVSNYNNWRNKFKNISPQNKEQVHISEEYFNQVNEVTEKLLSFYNDLKNDDDLLNLLKKHLHQKNGIVKDTDLVYLLFCVDIKTCYDNLQIPIDFRTKESLGFNIFSKRALGLSEVKYFQVETLMDLSKDNHNTVLNMINAANLQGEVSYIFLIADLLYITDRQKMKQYMVLMYRFASIVAKADGNISEVEQKWLSKLLKLSDINDDLQTTEKFSENDNMPTLYPTELDPLFENAAQLVVSLQQGSSSLIQRKLSIGYNRAGRIVDQLEIHNIISPPNNAGRRDVLICCEKDLEIALKRIKSKHNEKVKSITERFDRIYPSLKSTSQEELDTLIGLTSVKEEIKTLSNFIKIQQQREAKGLKTSQLSYHCVFTGNPGTGKTTVARIIAEIYKELGILKKGHLIETDRSGLVAEYVGQTAVKTNKIIDSALDGVLFIDEAYSLVSKSENDYGKEAIATLLKRMEDDRNRLVVILAGYTKEMKVFINSNSGLQSRFNRYIEFPDYSAEELYGIFELKTKKFDYTISETAENKLKNYFNNLVDKKDKNFGNARFVRNFFEKTLEQQANRLASESNLTVQKLTEIKVEDVTIED